jgi:tetratricopeptide (TPR) repeat protein
MKHISFLLAIFAANFVLQGQTVDEKTLLQIVSNRNEKLIAKNDSLLLSIYSHTDSAAKVQLLNFFDKQSGSSNPYTAARSLTWQGVVVYRPPFQNNDAHVFMQRAINRAVESGDEYLMVQCFEIYAFHCMTAGKPETALFYFLKSAELREKLGDRFFYAKNINLFETLGDLLYKMQEYHQSVQYIKLAISLASPSTNIHSGTTNTLGLDYQRLHNYDSALYWFNKSLESARANDDSLWMGIVSGNTGAVYFEQKQDEKALPLLWSDYHTCLKSEMNNAGNTLHRIALICLRRNKTDSAMLLAKRALQIVTAGPEYNAGFVQNANHAVSEVFKKLGNTDSAFYYADIYHRIKDSIDLSVARNRADVVQARLDFEKTSNSISVLLNEKQAEKIRRNFLLGGILLLLVSGWFYFRWQRQRYLSRQHTLLHQKEMAEAEVKNAGEKLEEFTQNSINKNELIEKLQEQLQQQNMQVNEELLNQSILTENDWLRFKDMFEKANPGFINQLQSIAPDITTAEIRFAALTRLKLGNKHIASMLGIGADAVRKTKSRLRQRLQITSENGLEEFINNIRLSNGN